MKKTDKERPASPNEQEGRQEGTQEEDDEERTHP